LNQQWREDLFFTTISLGKVLAGIEALPAGKRRTMLSVVTADLLRDIFSTRILAYDAKAAEANAEIYAKTRAVGMTMHFPDAQIAAIAKSNGFAIATRDVVPFQAAGLEVINPWEYEI
jgi:toxin FitB